MIVYINRVTCMLLAIAIYCTPSFLSADEPKAPTVAELLQQAQSADSAEEAIDLASQALKQEPDNVTALFFRARVQAIIRQHAEAAKDYDHLLKLKPDEAEYYYSRGRSRFCAGLVDESVEDFDKYVELRPEVKSQQWERGIALYYAGRFEAGAKQFELYQTYHDNDVENATWRYLCMARDVGVEKARAELLPIENDTRVPMMQIYALYRGKMTPEDVLEAATTGIQAGPAAEARLNNNLFYAHLYLGLYYEAAGDEKLAREHMLIAADKHKIAHYMWDVAKLHADRFRDK